MPITRLFDDEDNYTDEGCRVGNAALRALRPFFTNRNYSTRELVALLTLELTSECVGEQVERHIRVRGERRRVPIPAPQDDPVDVVDVQNE